MFRSLGLAVVLMAVGASAQTEPTVVGFPLVLKKKLPEDAERAVVREYRRLMVTQKGIAVPTLSAWDAVVSELKRNDCEEQDDCLRQLAVTAGTLYAVFVKVDANPERTRVTASGRVVRKDGLKVVDWKSVELPADGGLEAASKAVLAKLFEAMALPGLPSSVPAAPAVVAAPAEVPTPANPAAVEAHPVEPKVDRTLTTAAYVTGGGGIVITAVGVVLLGTVASDSNRLGVRSDGVVTALPSDDAKATAASMGTRSVAGGVLVGVGTAAIVTSVVMFVLGSDEPLFGKWDVAAVPMRDGAFASVSRSF